MKKLNIYQARARMIERMKKKLRFILLTPHRPESLPVQHSLAEAVQCFSDVLGGSIDLWTAAERSIREEFAWTETHEDCLQHCVKVTSDLVGATNVDDILAAVSICSEVTYYAKARYGISESAINQGVRLLRKVVTTGTPSGLSGENFPDDPWPDDLTHSNH